MIAGRDLSRVPTVSVARLANYLKRKVEADQKLQFVGVEGEVSNWRVQASGHVNFSLKDRDAVIDCFAFASDAATFPALKNGDAVIVYGRVGTYEKKSSYQIVARAVELAGIGKLYARYDELKRRLAADGLFDETRRRALPRFPFRVALVGSPTGDGTRDFLTQARMRAPHVTVTLFETAVQGDVAPQIVAALERACASAPDLVVLARGGGSFEDLFVFSDERVVRAVRACRVPIVTAIGHEADVPLADLAADRRAATPSTAAQTVLPHRDELVREIRRDGTMLRRALDAKLERAHRALERIEHRSPLADPRQLLANRTQRVIAAAEALKGRTERRIARGRDGLAAIERRFWRAAPESRLVVRRTRYEGLRDRLAPAARRAVSDRRLAFDRIRSTLNIRFLAEKRGLRDELAIRLDRRDPLGRVPALRAAVADAARRLDAGAVRVWERRRNELGLLAARLDGNDPAAPLRRGYAIVEGADGTVIVAADQAPPGSRLRVRLARGELTARVETDGTDGGQQIGLF